MGCDTAEQRWIPIRSSLTMTPLDETSPLSRCITRNPHGCPPSQAKCVRFAEKEVRRTVPKQERGERKEEESKVLRVLHWPLTALSWHTLHR
ncbi:hypothetical protein JCM10213_009120 [Rhodosporidiobolus nylandii]